MDLDVDPIPCGLETACISEYVGESGRQSARAMRLRFARRRNTLT